MWRLGQEIWGRGKERGGDRRRRGVVSGEVNGRDDWRGYNQFSAVHGSFQVFSCFSIICFSS
jgi:hypothetical protein